MSIKFKSYIFFTVWFLLLIVPIISVLSNTPPKLLFTQDVILLNGFQRILGLLSFTLLFMQIMLGAFLLNWVQIIGARAYKLHITQGIFAYGFICIHIILNSALIYTVSGSFVSVLTDILPVFGTQRGLLVAYGKIAFVLVTLGVAAGYFRTNPFLRKYWRSVHVLNYGAFILTAFHSKGIGSDINLFPYTILYWVFVLGVSGTLVYRIYSAFLKNYFVAREPSQNK